MNRPSYIACIQHSQAAKKHLTLCGREHFGMEWLFQSIDHAAKAKELQERMLPCSKCVDALVVMLKEAVAKKPPGDKP